MGVQKHKWNHRIAVVCKKKNASNKIAYRSVKLFNSAKVALQLVGPGACERSITPFSLGSGSPDPTWRTQLSPDCSVFITQTCFLMGCPWCFQLLTIWTVATNQAEHMSGNNTNKTPGVWLLGAIHSWHDTCPLTLVLNCLCVISVVILMPVLRSLSFSP